MKSSGQNDHYPFGWRVFSAWDFLITERETADNKLASLTTAIRVRFVYLFLIAYRQVEYDRPAECCPVGLLLTVTDVSTTCAVVIFGFKVIVSRQLMVF